MGCGGGAVHDVEMQILETWRRNSWDLVCGGSNDLDLGLIFISILI